MSTNDNTSRTRPEIVEVSREELLRRRAALLDRIDHDVRAELDGIDFLLGDAAASAAPETSPDDDGRVEVPRVLLAEWHRLLVQMADSRGLGLIARGQMLETSGSIAYWAQQRAAAPVAAAPGIDIRARFERETADHAMTVRAATPAS